MKSNWGEFNITKHFVYVVTFLLITYFLVLWLVPAHWLESISFGNIMISNESIDFGGFGGLLSGIFAPLAFLWLLLNFKQQDKSLKIAEEQLRILQTEKENKSKVSRANFSDITYEFDRKTINPKPDSVVFVISFQADIKMSECYCEPLSEDSSFSLLARYSKPKIFLTGPRKNIKSGEKLYIAFILNLQGHNELGIFHDKANLKYIDEEGYHQNHEINLTYFKVENADQIADYQGSLIIIIQ